MRTRWTGLCAVMLAVSVQAQDGTISFESTRLEPGLYMLEGDGGFAGGNVGLSIGDDGVILIDDGLEPLADSLFETVQKLAGKPVTFVINTHVHGDHVGGNETLHQHGARIIAHDNVRKRMVDSGTAAVALPQLTFPERVTFHLNGRTATVTHVRHAHTDGDSIIQFPGINVIHTGDALFNGLFPFIDLDSGGSVDGYIAAQSRIIDMANDDTRLIPGHGPLASRNDLIAAHDMLVDARARVGKLVDEAMSQAQVLAAAPLADYDEDWSWDFVSTERMTRTLYRDLVQRR